MLQRVRALPGAVQAIWVIGLGGLAFRWSQSYRAGLGFDAKFGIGRDELTDPEGQRPQSSRDEDRG